MAEISYNWKRYWVPRDGGFSFDSDGFLLPPAKDADGFVWWKTDVTDFEELLAKPCLVLLGEPGIGKSFAIRDAERRARATRQVSHAAFFFRDLGSYNSDAFLVKDVFESPEFTRWQQNGGELHMFLDSFDECLLRVDAVAALLAEQFGRLQSVQNLFLRIASRTAEWQTSLEDALQQMCGKDSLGVYELAPLTREQVLEAAKAQLEEPERFVENVVASEVVSFAIKPLTLDLLIRVWRKRGGSPPPTQREIYEQGCLELCADSERRQTPKLRGRCSAEQRLAVASHVAAAMFFCNRPAVWTGSRQSAKPEADIAVSDLAYGSVAAQGNRLPVTESALREALDTGLFTARGRERLSWAHQTYGEFLAAHYLAQEKLTSRQVFDLLTHPHDPQHKLIPQLHEVAAWVAGEKQEIFDHLARTEPEVLLRSDVAAADSRTKEALVEALLSAFAADSVHGDWWPMRKRYRKIRHPQLASQLRRHLLNRGLPANARVEAVTMVEACELNELLPELVTLALDPTEPQNVREWAAAVVSRGADGELKMRLRPLAFGEAGADPNDELRGAGLKASWPGCISAPELFASLKEPVGHFHGLYDQFLSNELVENLPLADLPKALAWAETQPERHDRHTSYGGLVMRILDRAAEHLEDANVLAPFARTLLIRLRKDDYSTSGRESSLTKVLESRADLRLKLVEAMVPLFQDAQHDSFLAHWRLRLIVAEDVPWLVEQLRSSNQPTIQRAYACLLSRIFYPSDASRVAILLEAAQECPVLVEVMPYWLKPILLDSEEARKAREYHIEEQRYREETETRRQPKLLSPPPAVRLVTLLEELEAGDIDAWWKLHTWLEVEDNGQYCEKHYHMDIRKLAGWKSATEATKGRMIAAADRYVRVRGPNTEEWFLRQNITYHPAVAGFRALMLLANEAPAQFAALPDDVWKRWMPAVLRPHYYDEREAHRLVTSNAFERAPSEAAEWTVKVINQENKEGDNLWLLAKLPERWSADFGRVLLTRAKRGRLKPQCTAQLSTTLLEHRVAGALDLVRSFIPKKPPARASRRLVSLFAGRLLMLHGEVTDWPRIWRLLNIDPAFGCDLLTGFAHDYGHAPAPVLRTLREPDVGALWEWMLAQYPVAEDRNRNRGGEVTIRDAMADFRDHLISHLANIGTEAGCKELRRLIGKHPQFTWFRRVHLRAEEQMRRNTWNPPAPIQLFQLAENRNARLVQSPSQLLEAVSESLAGLQEKLRGERQMAQFLWNGDRPKPEEAISDWVAVFLADDLKQRGVVLGREVQIHRFDKTDIHVTAVTRDRRSGVFESVKAIIEVKGCWHPEVKTAMQNQLVERYLADNECQHGLYLVAWFPLESWNRSDYRRKQVPFKKRNDLESYLAKQAESLSSGLTLRAEVLDFSIQTPKNLLRGRRTAKKKSALNRSLLKRHRRDPR